MKNELKHLCLLDKLKALWLRDLLLLHQKIDTIFIIKNGLVSIWTNGWLNTPTDKTLTQLSRGGSPGLVVMGGGSCSKGHGFESRFCILDGHDVFHIYLLSKLYRCLFENTEKNKKEAAVGPFLNQLSK